MFFGSGIGNCPRIWRPRSVPAPMATSSIAGSMLSAKLRLWNSFVSRPACEARSGILQDHVAERQRDTPAARHAVIALAGLDAVSPLVTGLVLHHQRTAQPQQD